MRKYAEWNVFLWQCVLYYSLLSQTSFEKSKWKVAQYQLFFSYIHEQLFLRNIYFFIIWKHSGGHKYHHDNSRGEVLNRNFGVQD